MPLELVASFRQTSNARFKLWRSTFRMPKWLLIIKFNPNTAHVWSYLLRCSNLIRGEITLKASIYHIIAYCFGEGKIPEG